MFNTPEEVYYSIIAGVILMLFLATIFVLSIVRYQRRGLEFRDEKIRIEQQYKEALGQSQIEIQEQTLQYISQELHDNIGQTASLVKIYLNTINFQESENTKAIVHESKTLLKQLISDLKALALNLDGDRIQDDGFVKSLKKNLERVNRLGHINTFFEHIGPEPTLSANNTIITYRMAQEILNNCIKHAQCTEIKMVLEVTEKLIILSVQDNGVGFEHAKLDVFKSSGLRNLKKRAMLINSNLNIESTLGNGTKVLVEIPNHQFNARTP